MGPTGVAYARRMGAKVAMGSKVKKSTRILLHRSGFSTRRPCEVPGTTAVLKRQIGRSQWHVQEELRHHHQCSATDAPQVIRRQCRAESMHLIKLLLHDLVMLLAVRGDLPVTADEECWRFQAGLNIYHILHQMSVRPRIRPFHSKINRPACTSLLFTFLHL